MGFSRSAVGKARESIMHSDFGNHLGSLSSRSTLPVGGPGLEVGLGISAVNSADNGIAATAFTMLSY